ncbi:MAG: DUF362 domain-containing protein [Chloroflexi bacterium]|nr:DUF362 domain-containing protein [Chloroflexota bacterium]
MKMHPLLQDPAAVLVIHNLLPAGAGAAVPWAQFQRAAREALAALQLELDGERVVIKPNVTAGERFQDPDCGIGVHPGFVQGMIEHLVGHGARASRITIAEDPRDTDDNDPRHWRGTGYDTMAPAMGVKLYSPTTYTCVKRPVPRPLAHPVLNVSRLAVQPGAVLLNVPKLKTHNLGITTLCLKNLMGLVNVFDRHYCGQAWKELPEEARSDPRPRGEWLTRELHERWQEGLARRLADTAQVIRPTLNVVEGVVGREGTGFQRGRNRALGWVIAGVNVVAVDSVASYLMGFDPQKLIYLQVATAAGLGESDLGKLRVYAAQGAEFAPCDPAALRADPPFRVISNIVGEDPGLFAEGEQGV